MASTVRNITVQEAFETALKLINEYSIRGNVQTGTKIADFEKQKFTLANNGQMELSLIVPIEDTTEIIHYKTATLTNPDRGMEVVSHINADVDLMEVNGPLSYYFESNANSGTYTIEEETSTDVWNELEAPSFDTTAEGYVKYAGHITASDTDNDVRIVLKGSYPYKVTNYVMYGITFPSDATVAEFGAYIEYDLPLDFKDIADVTVNDIPTNNYRLTADKILLNREIEGHYIITYHKLPKVIDEDSGDTYEFEIKKDAQHLVAYIMAAHMAADSKPALANIAFAEYEKKLSLIDGAKQKRRQQRVRSPLWGGRGNDQN